MRNEVWKMRNRMWEKRIEFCEMTNDLYKMRNEKWKMKYAKWKMKCAKREMRTAKWKIRNEKRKMWNEERGMRHEKCSMRNEKRDVENEKWMTLLQILRRNKCTVFLNVFPELFFLFLCSLNSKNAVKHKNVSETCSTYFSPWPRDRRDRLHSWQVNCETVYVYVGGKKTLYTITKRTRPWI